MQKRDIMYKEYLHVLQTAKNFTNSKEDRREIRGDRHRPYTPNVVGILSMQILNITNKGE